MIFPEKRKLFTINEVSRACGLSRTTLIRLEESGFFTPYRIDPDTGYRYYDAYNVTVLGEYLRLQAVGLSRREIADLYYERVDSAEFLRSQRQKLSDLQRFLDEYELRHSHAKNHSISYVSLPAATCYCDELTSSSFAETETLAYLSYEKAIDTGYRLLSGKSPFIISDDWPKRTGPSEAGYRFTFCIPVMPDRKSGSLLRVFPVTDALSILGFGSYSVVPELCARLLRELDARGLEPSGPMRIVVLVAPYAGTHYKSDDFCYECVVPIKERNEQASS